MAKTRGRLPKVHNLADGHENKRCPAGLSQTILSIQQNWLAANGIKASKAQPLDHSTFVADSDFAAVFAETVERFPRVGRPPKSDIADALYEMARGNSDMEYYRVRAFAKFVNLRPAGLFLIFTQLVSLEREMLAQGTDPAVACLNLISAIKAVLAHAEQAIKNSKAGEPLFHKQYNPKNPPMPSMDVLKKWSEIFVSIDEYCKKR